MVSAPSGTSDATRRKISELLVLKVRVTVAGRKSVLRRCQQAYLSLYTLRASNLLSTERTRLSAFDLRQVLDSFSWRFSDRGQLDVPFRFLECESRRKEWRS